ncbi:serine hydrolase [Stieleria sp. JC731]|uniref:serine hydrolase n=1 Tax=Pirellulaceae TaxID=2691357 RepID=UPI001E35C656|nr:serine hydrolase [Stieleria sp. JC731]MCC9602274.1 serine hydrolase [Stieleria sp. JC731]
MIRQVRQFANVVQDACVFLAFFAPAFVVGMLAEKNLMAVEPQDAQEVASPDFSDFDEFIDRVLREWKVPGVAVGVISEDRVILAKGYGARDIENDLPVTSKTLFSIASITKPFTATAVAMLVDEGKLDWNDRVHDHLHDFQLSDADATVQLSVRDCLAHRTGLAMAGLRWYGVKGWPEEHITPAQSYRTLRYLELTSRPRSTFQYSNSGYLIAGQLIEGLSEQSWEEFIESRLLKPLGMTTSNFSIQNSQSNSDHAQPYGMVGDQVAPRPFFPGEVVGPVAGINSNVDDMIRFLQFNLAQGEFNETQVVSKASMRELLTPEVAMPEFNRFDETTGFHSMGWQIFLIRGEKWARHTGSIPGFTAVAAFCPKRQCAYVVLTNLAYRPTAELIELNIRSRLLGRQPKDEFAFYRNLEQAGSEAYEQARLARRPAQVQATSPTFPLERYVGVYSHPAFGTFEVLLQDRQLRWHHHGFRGPLAHYHFDSFDMEGDRTYNGIVDDDIRRELVSFHANSNGDIESLSLVRFPVPSPVIFTKADVQRQ